MGFKSTLPYVMLCRATSGGLRPPEVPPPARLRRAGGGGVLAAPVALASAMMCISSIPTNIAVLPLPHIPGLEQDIDNPSYMYFVTNM